MDTNSRAIKISCIFIIVCIQFNKTEFTFSSFSPIKKTVLSEIPMNKDWYR